MRNPSLKLAFASVVLASCLYAAGVSSASAFDNEIQLRCSWFQQQSWKAARLANEQPPGSRAEERLRQKAQCWRQTYNRCLRGVIFPQERPC